MALRQATVDIKAALVRLDADAVAEAAARMALAGGKAPMKTLLGHLARIPATHDAIYWALVRGVVSFSDRPGLEVLGEYIRKKKNRAVSRDLLYGLARNRSRNAVFAVESILFSGPDDLRALALANLTRIRSIRTVDVLIQVLEQEEKDHPGETTPPMWVAASGLRRLTGKSLGASAANWAGWWKRNREQGLSRGAGHDVGELAGGTAVDFLDLDEERARAYRGLEQADPRSVVVLSAIYKKLGRDYNNDHIENELYSLGVPHLTVPRDEFKDFDLSKTSVVLVNCAQFHRHCICPTCIPTGGLRNRLRTCSGCDKHIRVSSKLTLGDVEKLRDFVLKGGFLFCEDWTVKEIVERAFPKFVTAGVKLVREPLAPERPTAGQAQGADPFVVLEDPLVDVVPARGMATHPYLRGIYTPPDDEEEDEYAETPDDDGARTGRQPRTVVLHKPDQLDQPAKAEPLDVSHTWSIDDESYSLKIVNRDRVVRLLVSGDIQQLTKDEGAVAVAFRPGPSGAPRPGSPASGAHPGVVVIMLSHFGRQYSTEDERSLQHILLNVLLDAHADR